jgi:glycosyltransferase involved in cell wall biosynthesis
MKKKFPLISIIINCHNGEKYLTDALKSIFIQSYTNWEIIFWDNNSNDKSKKIFNSFKNNRLKYFYTKNKTSLYKARNLALKKAKGEFITFLDTDDMWAKHKLKKQINCFKKKKKVGLVYSNFWLMKDNYRKIKLFKKFSKTHSLFKRSILLNYEIGILTVMIRRNILISLKKIFIENFSHIGDMDLMWRLSRICEFVSIKEPLAYYRLHQNSLSYTNKDNEIKELKKWVTDNKKKLNEKELNETYKKIANKKFLTNKLRNKYLSCFKIIYNSKYFKINIKNFVILITPNWILKKFIWF